MIWFILVSLCVGRVVSDMFPNERLSLDDCDQRFHTGYQADIASASFGTPATKEEFPHMAAIGWTSSNGTVQWRCGGSLVWYNFVLTAAHCVRDSKSPDIVRLGDIDFKSDKWVQLFRIVKMIKHPAFGGRSRYHDIALLKLDRNVVVNDYVIPACLWNDEEVRFPKLVATGWGRIGEGDEFSPDLLKVSLKPISNQECSKYYNFDPKIEQGLQPQQLCAVDERMDTCEGDSGGPLQVKLVHNSRRTHFIVGITSFGSACGVSIPGVYTRVSSYFKWIIDTMRQNGAVDLEENYNETLCSLRFAANREKLEEFYTRNVEYTPDVLVKIQWKSKGAPDCYGVIVDENTVLTVADCATFNGSSPSQIIYLEKKIMSISRIYIHPEHVRGTAYNNIAILKMNRLMDLPLNFHPSCITDNLDFGSYHMYGKGRTDINNHIIDKTQLLNPRQSIRRILTNLIHPSSCRVSERFYSILNYKLAPEHLCFGNEDFLVPKSCEQLTGSMIGYYSQGFYRTFALSLYSRDCGFGEHLIGTRLSSHIEWLKAVLLPEYRDSSAVQFVDIDLRKGDKCTLSNGRKGECVPLNECKDQLKQPKGHITFCSSASTVCCSSQNIDIRKLVHQDIFECPGLVKKIPNKNKYAYLVQIGWKVNGLVNFQCFGSIISQSSVITTASCLQYRQLPLVRHPASGVYLDVISLTQHSKFNLSVQANDIALIKLKNSLSWTETLFPICLWTNLTHTPLEIHINQYTYNYSHPTELHPRYNSDCQRAYPFMLQDSQLCTRSPYESAVCVAPGDQLIWFDRRNPSYYLVGLSNNACSPATKQYSLFTRISSFLQWISKNAF